MHQSSSLTSYRVLTGMQLVQVFCICTQSHHKVKLTAVYWRGLAPHNAYTTMDASPFPPLQSVIIENVITFNITYAHFNGVAFTTSYFKDKAHKSPSSNFCNCVLFFSILFHFFPSFFFFSEKKG